MSTSSPLRPFVLLLLPALALIGVGCSGGETIDSSGSTSPDAGRATQSARPGVTPVAPRADVKRKELGRHLWMETEGDHKRVRVEGKVCLRQGSYGLECFLCRTKLKEHESIVATSADAQLIHTALMAAGAEPGSPVRFEEGGFKPPTGSRVRISLEYEDKGKLMTAPAGYWIRDAKTKKEVDLTWVFAGSLLWPNPDGNDKPKIYAANTDGAYACVLNVPTAMLDVTIHTPTNPENRSFEPFTEHIPEVGTPVIVILEPIADKGGAKSTEAK